MGGVQVVFAYQFNFPKKLYWDMTTEQTLNYCRGAMMHYEMELNMHAMSEDAERGIKRQLQDIWNYMFPLDRGKRGERAKRELNEVKNKFGFD